MQECEDEGEDDGEAKPRASEGAPNEARRVYYGLAKDNKDFD